MGHLGKELLLGKILRLKEDKKVPYQGITLKGTEQSKPRGCAKTEVMFKFFSSFLQFLQCSGNTLMLSRFDLD